MLTPADFSKAFAAALPWDQYIATAKPHEAPGWLATFEQARLTPAQEALALSFARRVNVLVISGTWCGDCVQQAPLLERIARARPAPRQSPQAPGVDIRYLDRDQHAGFTANFKIASGGRVPVAIFLNEDFDFVSLMGDKTLARLRTLAAQSLGPACPLPGAPIPADERAAVTQDWLNEFERVALLLRLSAKLRARHND